MVEDPLQVDFDKDGADSDQLLVTSSPIGTLSDKKDVEKKRIKFRPLKDHGFLEMGNRLENSDFLTIKNLAFQPEVKMEFYKNVDC